MSNYNPNNPILFLNGTVSASSVVSRYEYDDSTNLGPSGLNIPIVTEITVNSIDPQDIGYFANREGGQYTALDIKTGDWVADAAGRKCLEIILIIEKSDSSIKFQARDVDAYSYKNFRSNLFSDDDPICFFETSDNGAALLSGDTSFFTSRDAIDKIQTRFTAAEESERYRIELGEPQSLVEEGDVVTVNGSGKLVPFAASSEDSYKIGILTELSYGDSIAYIKPFNKIVDNFTAPERLTGSVGQVYYNSAQNPGELVTDPELGQDRVFFQIKDPEPTIVQATQANLTMQEGDSLTINNVEVFAQLGTGESKTSTEIKDQINLDTAQHHVTASIVIPAAQIESNSEQTANGDVVLITSTDGGSTSSFPSATFSDGTNSTSVTFNTTDSVFPGTGGQYIAVSANQMVQDLNTAFQAAGVDLSAQTFEIEGTNNPNSFPGLRITAGSGSSIEVTNGDADAANQSFTAGTGLIDGFPAGVTEPVSTDELLTLTRADGGDIMLQGLGTFVNQNGMVSSSAGEPALLLMIEEEIGGISTADDLDWIPNNTSQDGDAAGITITYTPYEDSNVLVEVNGLGANLGDGVKTKDCYFSGDGGATARPIKDIEAGDGLYWNGSIAGFELEDTDLVDIIYDASSNDV
jgi:hypothetical protein